MGRVPRERLDLGLAGEVPDDDSLDEPFRAVPGILLHASPLHRLAAWAYLTGHVRHCNHGFWTGFVTWEIGGTVAEADGKLKEAAPEVVKPKTNFWGQRYYERDGVLEFLPATPARRVGMQIGFCLSLSLLFTIVIIEPNNMVHPIQFLGNMSTWFVVGFWYAMQKVAPGKLSTHAAWAGLLAAYMLAWALAGR